MKKHMLLAAALWVLASVVAMPAYGQKSEVRVKVPFGFVLADKSYPADDYVFSSEKDHVILGKPDGRRLAMLLANHASGRSAGKTGQVVFQCYDEQCFLSQVWIPGHDAGREVSRSRLEKEIAAKTTGKYMALLGTEGQR